MGVEDAAKQIASTGTIELLMFLLPGLVSTCVFYSLVPSPPPSPFKYTINALLFTALTQAVSLSLPWFSVSSIVPYVIAALLGTGAAISVNRDFPHRILRPLGITMETSYPSEWYSTWWRLFSEEPWFVVLHMQDESRLYGWPVEWPSHPTEGHFRIENGGWLDEDNNVIEPEVHAILVPMNSVETVEFMPLPEGSD